MINTCTRAAPPSDFDAAVILNEEVRPGIFRMILSAPGFSGTPGQFLGMEPGPGPFPMTRRPLTISRLHPLGFEVVFEVRGPGTGMLAERRPGEMVRTLGPLGRGWRLRPGRWLLVGGGMGAAGFPFLASALDRPPTILIGASTGNRLLCSGGEEFTATEDGSSGVMGLVTDLLAGLNLADYSAIAVCGPLSMMGAVWRTIPPAHRPKVQISAESRMGCGWGGCEGCSVPSSAGGYLKCCTDGPVFMGTEPDWERWME